MHGRARWDTSAKNRLGTRWCGMGCLGAGGWHRYPKPLHSANGKLANVFICVMHTKCLIIAAAPVIEFCCSLNSSDSDLKGRDHSYPNSAFI